RDRRSRYGRHRTARVGCRPGRESMAVNPRSVSAGTPRPGVRAAFRIPAMRTTASFEFPAEQQQALRRARRLEWITLLYMASAIVLMYLVMGSSQAMKSAWLEDLLSLVPPIVFLVAGRIALWPPTRRFPYGFHRAVAIAFLCASVALFAVGAWLL